MSGLGDSCVWDGWAAMAGGLDCRGVVNQEPSLMPKGRLRVLGFLGICMQAGGRLPRAGCHPLVTLTPCVQQRHQ